LARRYDAIVLGLGGMGSCALMALAGRGQRVLGIEQFHAAHALGSSHGGSRIIRKAYYEHPAYVPLVLRAYELWRELERQTASELLLISGGLMAGHEGSEIVEGALQSARLHSLAHEPLSAAGIRRRFPALQPLDDETGVYEPEAGILFPERCVLAAIQAATALGAEARFGVRVEAWEVESAGVRVAADGETLEAERLVLCAGAWMPSIASDLELPLEVERNVMHWFDSSRKSELGAPNIPIWVLERRGQRPFYGIPYLEGQGIKAAFHYSGQQTSPESIERAIANDEIEGVRQALAGWVTDGAQEWRQSVACMYTNTPDRHFLVGLHPEHERVAIAAGFSGHGFKFCPVIAEILADLLRDGQTFWDTRLFSLSRFQVR
jgi:sarcosine oxidase